MEDFLRELRELDETQERVEAVSDEMLRAQEEDEGGAKAKQMVEQWIAALRASDFQSERVAFLYVANHVLQKTLFGDTPVKAPHYLALFKDHLEEAVAFVSNSPMDRQNIMRLLELWHDKEVYPDGDILQMWKCTGEDLPDFLASLADDAVSKGHPANDSPHEHANGQLDSELYHAHLPALPMKLNARSANPVLDALKKIDHHKAVIHYLDQTIKQNHQFMLLHATARYKTPEDVLSDSTMTPSQVRQQVEDCLRLTKVRNPRDGKKFLMELPLLKAQLADAITTLKQEEKIAGSSIEQKLEQCDTIDIGLADLAEHRDTYLEEWSNEAEACNERKKLREEEQRLRDEEMVRLHQEAIAQSAAHAMDLEADMNSSSSSELKSLSKELTGKPIEKDPKADETNEMVWHPVLKELVPLQSLNLEWESWRDH